jgi:PAS domain S-box-containing protein
MSSLTGQADNLPKDSLQELKNAYQQAIKYARDLNEEVVERKRVEAVLAHRVAQLALINDIGSKIAAVLELDRVLERAARLVQETFDYHHVALFLVDENVARLKAVAGSYESYFLPGHSQRLSQGMIGWVITHGEKVIANDVTLESRYISLIAEHTITQAELCVPIKLADQTLGALDIQSPHLNAFDENDIIVVETLANEIAVAIENARLYQAVQLELAERKQAEAALQLAYAELEQRVEERTTALRESEMKYRALIQQSNDAIYLIYESRFEMVNRQFEKLFSVTQEGVIGAPDFVFADMVTPQSRPMVQELVSHATQGQPLRPHYEFTTLDKSGNEIELELTVSYLAYRGGLATQGIIRDITERKQIEIEKREAYQQVQQYAVELAEKVKEEQRQREIATILAEVVTSVSLTLATGELLDHILLKLQQLIPYDSATIFLVKGDYLVIEAARGFEVDVINHRYALAEDILFQEMLTQKSYILIGDTHADHRYQLRPGSEKIRGWIGAPLLVAQQIIGYLAIDRYVAYTFTEADANLVQAFAHQVAQTINNARLFAELKDAQVQLIQRERLAALGQMAATVAHELRNPLMAIHMGVEYLLRDMSETDPRRRGAALMQTNMDRINHIVENILYVARAPQPILTPGLLQTVIEAEVSRWELLLTTKKIACSMQFTTNLPPLLLDPDQMARIFSNLIGNSVDVLPPGGEISISLALLDQSQVVTFADNGPGMAPEYLLGIFEPFFTTKTRGTGLGLYIIKQIVEYHYGNITVWSEVGAGTKFTISLPLPEDK